MGVAHGPDRDPVVEHTGFRLSWGAIFAGLVIATMVQIVLSLLGIAIGMDVWDPREAGSGMGMAAGIWAIVVALVSLYIGGVVTGRLAGVLTRGDGVLHGLVMWGLTSLLAVFLLATSVGFVLSTTFGILGRTTAALAGGLARGGVELVQQAPGLDLDRLQQEIETTLGQTGVPELQPDTLRQEVEEVRGTATTGASNRELAREIADLYRTRAGAVDREAIINVIVARTGMNRQEAEQLATRIESAAETAQARIGATVDTLQQRAVGTVATASETLATASWWALLALILSAAAAALGAAQKARE